MPIHQICRDTEEPRHTLAILGYTRCLRNETVCEDSCGPLEKNNKNKSVCYKSIFEDVSPPISNFEQHLILIEEPLNQIITYVPVQPRPQVICIQRSFFFASYFDP